MRSCRLGGSLSLLPLFFFLGGVLAAPPSQLRQVHQFSNPTYLQSLYVRSNGDILVTSVWPNASIFSVTGATTSKPNVSLVHEFNNINAVTAIIETQPNVFAFIGGNQTYLGIGVNGTFGIWELDLRPTLKSNPEKPSIKELVRIPDGGLLAAVDALPNSSTTLLVSDSTMGVVWKVDTLAGKYELAIKDKNMPSPPWGATQFGVNCIRIHNGYLYWTNSYEATIYRIPITSSGYPVAGAKSEVVVAVHSIFLDGFTFGPRGGDSIWAVTNADNRLVLIKPDGNASFIAGEPNQMTMAGAVAPAFGKLESDTDTLYVVTGGALVFPINGTVTEGGKVLAFDSRAFQ